MVDINGVDEVKAVVIGTGTGDGTTPSRIVGVTPGYLPNIAARVIGPVLAMAIRFAKNFLTVFLGLISAAEVATRVQPAQINESITVLRQMDWRVCLTLSLAAAVFNLGKDALFILGGLEQKFPLTGV